MISPEMFVAAAMAGAFLSTVVNVRAALLSGSSPWTRYFWLVAALSLFYVLAWGYLLWDPAPDRGQWSEVVTPISTLTFFTVWIGPALLLLAHESSDRYES